MTSFNAIEDPTITPEPTPPADALTIENVAWFPSVDLAHMREAVRLTGTVTTARLRDAAIAAIDEVNRELASWRADQRFSSSAANADGNRLTMPSAINTPVTACRPKPRSLPTRSRKLKVID